MDFFNVLNISQGGNVYLNDSALSSNKMLTANYFPFTFFIARLFAFTPKFSFVAYYILLITTNLYFVYTLFKDKLLGGYSINLAHNVFVIAFLSYPFLYLLDRGNFEGLLYIFLIGFTLSYLKKCYTLAAIFIALASAMKLYPCILALLFIKNKQYRYLIFSAILTVLISVVSILTLHGGIVENISGLIREMSYFQNLYSLTPNTSNTNGLSFFGTVKIVSYLFGYSNIHKLYTIFNFIALMYLSFVTFFILKKENEIWKQLMLLISFTILFMGTSFEYKMISILLPFLLFLTSEKQTKYDIGYIAAFCFLLIPKQIFASHHGFSFSVSMLLDVMVLFYMNILIIKEKFRK